MSTMDQMERLEAKVDKLIDAVQRLVVIEERQRATGERIGVVESRQDKTEENLMLLRRDHEKWTNRIIGGYFAVASTAGVIGAIIGWLFSVR